MDSRGQYWNPYNYCANPIMYVDPDGNFFFLGALLGAAGTALGVAGTAAGIAGVGAGIAGIGAGTAVGAAGIGLGVAGTGAGIAGLGVGTGVGLATTAFGTAYPFGHAVNDFSYVWRMFSGDDPANDIFGDYVTGGFFLGSVGNTLGLMNLTAGGSMDWYDGYSVYSGGLIGPIFKSNGWGGSEYFGPALMVADRNNKRTIAHEIRHMRQMQYTGKRIEYIYDYVIKHKTLGTGGDYYSNPYEVEAYFYDYAYAYGEKYYGIPINIYGKGDIHNQTLIDGFIRYYYREYGVQLPLDWQPERSSQ